METKNLTFIFFHFEKEHLEWANKLFKNMSLQPSLSNKMKEKKKLLQWENIAKNIYNFIRQ